MQERDHVQSSSVRSLVSKVLRLYIIMYCTDIPSGADGKSFSRATQAFSFVRRPQSICTVWETKILLPQGISSIPAIRHLNSNDESGGT